MNNSIFIVVALCLLQCTCFGLEMTLNKTFIRQPGTDEDSACGVLTCVEEINPAELKSITSLTIYRKRSIPDSIQQKGQLSSRVHIASVTAGHPNISVVTQDRSKIEGLLSERHASIQVRLSEQKQCLAVFTCNVRMVDIKGVQHLSLTRLDGNKLHDGHNTGKRHSSRADSGEVEKGNEDIVTKMETILRDISASQTHLLSDQIKTLSQKLKAIENQLTEQLTSTSQSSDLQEALQPLETKLSDMDQQLSTFSSYFAEREQCKKDNSSVVIDEIQTIDRSIEVAAETCFNNLEHFLNETIHRSQPDVGSLSSKSEDIKRPEFCHGNYGPVSKSYIETNQNKEIKLILPTLCDLPFSFDEWIVIQQRDDIFYQNGQQSPNEFEKPWDLYKVGFGNFDKNFWLGNDKIHKITESGTFQLRVTLRYKGKTSFAYYQSFYLEGEEHYYVLRLGAYTGGDAKDSLSGHNGMAFSTKDRDHDKYAKNCADIYKGAWWYNACHYSNLNGRWGANNNEGPRWNSLTGSDPVDYSQMAIRRVGERLSVGKESKQED